MRNAAVLLISVPLFFISLIFPPDTFCESPSLTKGIEQYKQENYIEAINILEKARKEDPNSSAAAFFLGLSYKQMLDYQKALEHLRDAVTLTPRIKEALVEIVEVLYQIYEVGKPEEAEKWIKVAEEEKIFPAKIAFLKGLLLQKEGKNLEAVESFEKAKGLDKTLAQSADIQIALCYLKEKDLKKAKGRFQIAVQHDPQSDLGRFCTAVSGYGGKTNRSRKAAPSDLESVRAIRHQCGARTQRICTGTRHYGRGEPYHSSHASIRLCTCS